jgi:adenylate cyclase
MIGFVVTLAFTILATQYYSSSRDQRANDEPSSIFKLIQQIHEKSIDFRLIDRGEQKGSDQIVILAVDEKSIEQEGRWPWPRDKMANLIQRALSYGSKTIAFDMIWSEPDNSSSGPTLKRLKQNLYDEKRLAPDAQRMFDKEIENSDTDRTFANTVSGYADNLIMGSYFEEYVGGGALAFNASQEGCLSTLFSRTTEGKYWDHEAIKIQINDQSPEIKITPSEVSERFLEYFTQLEIKAAGDWFEHNPSKIASMEAVLKKFGSPFPPEAFPGLASVWVTDNTEIIMEFLKQNAPHLANESSLSQILENFELAFTRKEKAMLLQDIRLAGESYCRRFGTPSDDLQSLEAYQKQWGESEDIQQTFESINMIGLGTKNKNQLAQNQVENVARWWINIPQIAANTKHSGAFNAFLDLDGTVRRSLLFSRRGNQYMPSLALKTFLVANKYALKATLANESQPKNGVIAKVVKRLDVLDDSGKSVMEIPVDPFARIMINYSGKKNMFPYISAGDLLSDHPTAVVGSREFNQTTGRFSFREKRVDKREFLKDKILMVSATAVGIYDLRVTPFEENYPGVETHANLLSNLMIERDRLQNRNVQGPGFLYTIENESLYMWPSLLLLGGLLTILLSAFGSITGLLITLVAIATVYLTDKYIIFKSGVVVTIIFPLALIAANFISLTFYKYFTEEKKKRQLKGTFEKYVSPSIVAEVLSDPENIELGGKKMELTVMFSDVRGFTSISEKLDPRALSNLLNSYLTPMTNLVFANKGTLDKYMGDAIMAFWGAPIHFPDHAQHACRCALKMLVKLKELQEEYRSKGLPEIDIGIGLNTGEMSVGNMGSDTVRSYTVMGDAVNLGSRLEGINKQYGTRIIISEFTHQAIQDTFVTREVDWVRVKGKAQPVRIFELIAEGSVDDKKTLLLEAFAKGFALYHLGEFKNAIEAFTASLTIEPNDAVSQLYLERCQKYLITPPAVNWDGVYVMTSK